jgi:hypothetical protein
MKVRFEQIRIIDFTFIYFLDLVSISCITNNFHQSPNIKSGMKRTVRLGSNNVDRDCCKLERIC